MVSVISEKPLSPLAQSTLGHLESALTSSSTAGLADIVKLVQMLSSDAVDISIHQLADIIEKDAVVSTKCISAANKLGYNTTGVEIASIPQAVQVVGFNKIRSLAVSLLLLENATALTHPEPRQNTKISLCAGLLARAWARQAGKTDPDRHFLCGSLRNFGRLLASTHQLEDYRLTLAAISGGQPADAAFREHFGLSPAELTHGVLTRLTLPAPVLRALAPFPAEAGRRPPTGEWDEIALVAEFFHHYCELALDPHVKPLDYQAATVVLLRRFSGLEMTDESLDALLEQTEKTLKVYAEGSSLSQVASPLAQLIAFRRVRVVEPKKETPPVASPAKVASLVPDPTPTAQLDLRSALGQMSDELARPLLRLEKVVLAAWEGVCQQWTSRHVVLFFGSNGAFRVAGNTPFPSHAKSRPQPFRGQDPHLLALAVNRGEPLVVADLTEPRLQAALPPWLGEQGLGSCLLLPIGARDACTLLVFVGWESAHRPQLTPEVLRDQKTMANLLLTAQRLAALQ